MPINFFYILMILFFSCSDNQPNQDIIIGAYYFDGWRDNTNHLTNSLMDTFAIRKPVWGWNSSGQMAKEIKLATSAGLNYFSFCWYLRDADEQTYYRDKYNQGLFEFIEEDGLGLMSFSILVANHAGGEITPANWELANRLWIDLFEKKCYMKLDGEPMLAFFSIRSLIKEFGSAQKVKLAFDDLRSKVVKAGFKGVKIAVCVSSVDSECQQAVDAGADILTGYNHAYEGIKKEMIAYPIEILRKNSEKTWAKIASFRLPVIPAVTLNWDPRPWSRGNGLLEKSHRFYGYTSSSCEETIRSVRSWLDNNSSNDRELRMAVIYAWNEYGEGAWLTPSDSDSLLNAVKTGLTK